MRARRVARWSARCIAARPHFRSIGVPPADGTVARLLHSHHLPGIQTMRRRAFVLLTALACASPLATREARAQNLLVNPSFEDASMGYDRYAERGFESGFDERCSLAKDG